MKALLVQALVVALSIGCAVAGTDTVTPAPAEIVEQLQAKAAEVLLRESRVADATDRDLPVASGEKYRYGWTRFAQLRVARICRDVSIDAWAVNSLVHPIQGEVRFTHWIVDTARFLRGPRKHCVDRTYEHCVEHGGRRPKPDERARTAEYAKTFAEDHRITFVYEDGRWIEQDHEVSEWRLLSNAKPPLESPE